MLNNYLCDFLSHHLDNKHFSFFVLAKDIENSPSLVLFQAEHLDVPKRDVDYHFLLDNFIEKTDDKIFT